MIIFHNAYNEILSNKNKVSLVVANRLTNFQRVKLEQRVV
jgi:hypothetical protein